MLLNNEDSWIYCLSSHPTVSTGSILFITGLCIAVIPCDRDTAFLFDSHSHNREGRPDLNGYSLLLKFPDLLAFFCSRLVRNLKNRIQNLNFAPVFAIDQTENAKPSKIRKNRFEFQLWKSHYISDHTCVNKFLKMIKQLSFYFCGVYNRFLYRGNLKVLKPKNYGQEFLSTVNTKVKSFDGKVCICKTCHLPVSKSKVSWQGVANNLYLDEIPETNFE